MVATMANIDREKLIQAASKGLGISPESLRAALEKGDTAAITSKLSEKDRAKVNEVLNNPKMAEKFKKQYGGNNDKL